MNAFLPFQGIQVLPFSANFFWKGKLLGLFEGDENSVAKKMALHIENSKNIYPYCNYYRLSGPNSNTFAQWVLNNFPEFKVKLPWNSFGKNYKME